jgi:hypothetical protein
MLARDLAIALLAIAFASSPGCKKKESADSTDESSGSSKKSKSKKGDKDEAEEEDDEGSSKKKGAECPGAFHDFPDHDSKEEQTCVCPKGSESGSVYGTDIYTEDSSPCAAAVHAGVIESKGGKIKMKHMKGCPAYTGSKKNGVASTAWGEFGGSFYFPDKTESPKCPIGECPHSFGEIKDVGPKSEIECKCGTYAEGTVYGTDMYTQDSSICAAAKHAGLIDDNGGTVKAKAAPGCGKYEGKKQNGVESHEWHEYKASFYFPKKGDGVCKVPK